MQDRLTTRYVRLLRRCAEAGYPIGCRETTARERGVTDWEAAAFLPTADLGDVTVHDIEAVRERLIEEGCPIGRDGSRKGKDVWTWAPTTEQAGGADQATLF